jgi:hypothetical protein
MKKFLLSLAIVALVVTSCDLFGDLDDINFSTDFTASYDVTVATDSAKLDKVINLKDDAEIEKYQSKLKDVTVDSVILSISDYTSNSNVTDNKLSGSLKYSDVTSTSPLLFATISGLELKNGAKTKITAAPAVLSAVQMIMKDKKEIKVYLRGKTLGAATFKLNVKYYVTVKAEALD